MNYLKFIPENLQSYFNDTTKKYEINTDLRIAHFLSQLLHESSTFTRTSENMNYSATRLMEVFHKYFPTIELANQYAHKPELIASKVYANRMGNGDEASKDGWNYRGKGFVQLTGKSNYQLYKDHSGIDVVTNPELLLLSANAMDSSGWFFAVLKNLNPIADMGKEDYVIEKITRSVNGALNGIESRKQFFHNILDSTE